MAQICSRCGGTEFHYNQSRMRIECDLCGNPLNELALQEQQLEYDRKYAHAMEHLRAGNWDQTISILTPLTHEKPTDKNLYAAIFRAATHDLRDIEMADGSRRRAASEAWDKLLRLGGLTSGMLAYSRRRSELHITELMQKRNKILGWLITAAAACFLAGVAVSCDSDFIALLLFGFGGYSLYTISIMSPAATVKQLSAKLPDYRSNPFV